VLASGDGWAVVAKPAGMPSVPHARHPGADAATVAGMPAAHRLALTGTPLENHLIELWSVFEFLMPGFFGSRAAFIRRYAQPIQRDREVGALRARRRRHATQAE
jgi:hypothetical protein